MLATRNSERNAKFLARSLQIVDIYVHSSAKMTKSRTIANNLFKKTAGMRSFQGTMRLCVEYSYLSIFKFLLGIIVLPDTDQRTLLRTCLSTTRLRPCVEDDLLGGLVCRRPSLSRNDKEAIAVRPLGQRRVFWIDREHCMQRAGKHTLDCRHTVRSVCGDSLEKKLALTCTVSEMVTLPCGHLYRLQCGSKESEKPLDKMYCRYLYQLTINR